MSEFIRYSDDDIQRAKSSDILDVVRRLGFTPINQGSVYTLKEHDSLKIYPETNSYFQFSTGKGGNPINFVREFGNLDFKEAIKFLIGNENISISLDTVSNDKKIQERKKFELPKFNKDLKRTYAYLLQTRKINKEVVNECVKYGIIREDEKHNICFLGKDKFGNVKYCAFNGTITDKRFKGEVEGSNKAFSFNINNNVDKLIICESPIDVLSAISILKLNNMDKEFSFISVSGLTEIPITHFLEENKNVKNLLFMLDNDERGADGFKRLSEKFTNKYNIKNFSYLYKDHKDVNDYLVKTEISKEQEQQKLRILYKELKQEIINFCNREYEEKYSYEDFDKIYSDLEHIGIAYTTTPDEKFEIQYEINLKKLTSTQYVNKIPITKINYLEGFTKEQALNFLIDDIKNTDFNELIRVNEEDLKSELGLEIADDGNFFKSIEKTGEILENDLTYEEEMEIEF